MQDRFLLRQLFDAQTSTYTYLLADSVSKEAVLIDSVLEMVDRDLQVIQGLDLKLLYTLETHVHADHITGAAEIQKRVGSKIVLGAHSGASGADILLQDKQCLSFGSLSLQALETPGHTRGCLSYYCEGCVFTGDSLMIGLAGRTDFQEGSSALLYRSITERLFTLPAETKVFPGHDYRGFTSSTIGEEIRMNMRVGGGKSESDFIQIMSDLKLASPKKIDEAVPANLRCGRDAITKRI